MFYTADIPDQYGCIDYFSAPNPNPIIFPAGTSPGVAGATQCSSITINDDNCCELTESFGVTASSNDPDVMFPNGDFAIVNIEDNDCERIKCPAIIFAQIHVE